MDTARATLLLRRYGEGDRAAADELLPLLYEELRGIARARMAGERAEHTLQPTALVHEAWMRLVDDPAGDVSGREHFLCLAARVMRRVLVDHARARGAAKRGGEFERLPLDDALQLYDDRALDVTTLDEVLQRLAGVDEQLARIVELRFFAGLGNAEVAEVEGLSLRSAERAWASARAWLRRALQAGERDGG